MNAKISILFPNLNNYQFLRERFQSIFLQTFSNWELIVVDAYSTDGSWELIQHYAKQDLRICATQMPRRGIYAGINECIKLSTGDYIYIATSDDTMTPDCLKKMVSALDIHSECDICHCCLNIIDETSQVLKGEWTELLATQFYKPYLEHTHIRIAPCDAILYCCLNTVYSSLTQLLIRRSVFDKVGLFKSEFGSQGDLEWGIRAAFQCNTLHIPEYLATWRRHAKQATQDSIIDSPQAKAVLVKAVKEGIHAAMSQYPEFNLKIGMHHLTFCYRFEQLERQVWLQPNLVNKLLAVLNFFFLRPDVAMSFLLDKANLFRFNRIRFAQKLLAQQGLHNCIQRVSD